MFPVSTGDNLYYVRGLFTEGLYSPTRDLGLKNKQMA